MEAEVSQLELNRLRRRCRGSDNAFGGERTPGHLEFDGHFRKPIVMPDIYDGESSWDRYLAHFTTCVEINGWTDIEKCKFLSVRLKGHAQEV